MKIFLHIYFHQGYNRHEGGGWAEILLYLLPPMRNFIISGRNNLFLISLGANLAGVYTRP